MRNNLMADLKGLINDLKEEAEVAKVKGDTGFVTAATYARVNIEALIEKHGGQRPLNIECEVLDSGDTDQLPSNI